MYALENVPLYARFSLRLFICPQFDALDLMDTREHLSFYARVKGIKDVKSNVGPRLNLTPHSSTLASKASGGNKSKLSLTIALMGTPPVLVLDEPTSAMRGRRDEALAFWKTIQTITPSRFLPLTVSLRKSCDEASQTLTPSPRRLAWEAADTLATRAAITPKRILAVGTHKRPPRQVQHPLLRQPPDGPGPQHDPRGNGARPRLGSTSTSPLSSSNATCSAARFASPAPGIDAEGKRPVAGVVDLARAQRAEPGPGVLLRGRRDARESVSERCEGE
ncbi:hypothetical protein TPAR_08462 [Tolypocladium paradoxum]|uniref:Uncharacterized protein n=1 Tax=Tolypocladium paradoxum TaxID=94208 RepID=A0A2S4KM68_9HYPO|nr:hypothetical protein TPAR_08462 [Tolypocladium paradoxum]